MIQLSSELKDKIKQLFMEAAKTEAQNEEHWVILMMEQDHYHVILERLEPEEFSLVKRQMKQTGCYPSEEVEAIIDQVEIEVFGRVVCG